MKLAKAKRTATSAEQYERIYAVIRRIPKGKVATYGQVALLAGLRGYARMVGYALRHSSPTDRLPWQRVIQTGGRIAERAAQSGSESLQRAILESEGVKFTRTGKVDLERFLWDPGPREMRRKSPVKAPAKSHAK